MSLRLNEYYRPAAKQSKKLAPDLLYLGCRMDFHLYPEDTSLNDIIKIAAKYCDVVSFNRYRYTCAELVPPDGGDYPLIIGEYHFGSLEQDCFNLVYAMLLIRMKERSCLDIT